MVDSWDREELERPRVVSPVPHPIAVEIFKPVDLKTNEGKDLWHLMPFDALRLVLKVIEYGAKKYRPDNWRELTDLDMYFDANQRHLMAWKSGEKVASDSKLPHLAHAACNSLFMLWVECCREASK